MNGRHLAVPLISGVLLVAMVTAGAWFLDPGEEGVDGSGKVLPYSPVMRKTLGVDKRYSQSSIKSIS